MGVRLYSLLGGIGLLLVGCSEPVPGKVDPNYKSRSGQKIYTERCVICHGDDGKLCSAGAKDLSKSRMDSTGMVDIIKNGKNGMPRQAKYFVTDEELANTIEFVKSLRK